MSKNKLIGLILISIGFSLPFFSFTVKKVEKKQEERKLEEKITAKEDYFAILEIPSIHLKKELYPTSDKKNNVNHNVYVHNRSIFPNNYNGSIILASHSGTGKHAYFKDLYKLKCYDKVNLYYHNVKYIYEIKKIEKQAKTGELYLEQNKGNYLILITCTYKDKKSQTIYYASLKKKEKIA